MVLQASGGNATPLVPYQGKAPYPYNTLKSPLTSAQRSAVLAYCQHFFSATVGGSAGAGQGLTSPTWAQFTAYSDQSVINTYDSIVGNTPTPPGADPGFVDPTLGAVTGVHIPNVFSSVTDFLNFLTNKELWIRITEVILGLMLVGVGLSKLTGTDFAPLKKVGLI